MEKKRLLRRFTAFFAVVALACTTVLTVPAQAGSKVYTVTGKFCQTEARSMKKMINNFRTGDDAWAYSEDGKKVKYSGLKKYAYDYELEKIAMVRAMEISVVFSHTRPDGTSCFSAYPEGTYMMIGENIAMGTDSFMSAANTFEMWQETNDDYSGQGHRRNMLSEGFTSVGIACFEIDGNRYWVQEFGNPNSGAKKTKACNKTKTKKIKYVEP